MKWKGYDSSFNSWIDKKKLVWFYWLQFNWLQLQWIQFHWMQFHCIKMSQYFLKPYEPFGGDINIKVHLSNYATKADIKNVSYVDTLSFELKTNLASLKTKVDKLDMDNVVLVPVNLSKLSDIVKIDVKKTVYEKLVATVNSIDTSGFANCKELLKFKARYSEIVATLLCLGNISKDWSVDNMKDTGLNRYV